MKYQHIVSAITARPWAIQREKGEAICQVVAARVNGVAASKEEIQAAVGAARQGASRIEAAGTVAVIPVFGTIMHRASLMSEFSGGTTIEGTRKAFRLAMADPNVGAIVFEHDSPGGYVDGVPEFAAELAAARGQKPMAGIANTLSASASYWLLSQLEDVAITPSGEVGSIGVYMAHVDWSAWNEKEGVKVTYISYGDHKTEGNPDEPLAEETRAHLQAQVDTVGRQFDKAVAAGRKISLKAVAERFGRGRTFLADEALERGMVDRIATLDEVIDRMAAKVRKGGRSRTEDVQPHAVIGNITEQAVAAHARQAEADADYLRATVALTEPRR